MKPGFKPIGLREYVDLFLVANPSEVRANVVRRLREAIDAHVQGERCACGELIWIVGSAEVGLGCFTCITGTAEPDNDYEIQPEVN